MADSTPTALEEDTRSRWALAWDAEMIRAAERSAASGSLSLAAALCGEMIKDDRVSRAIRIRARSLILSPPKWESGAGGKRTALTAERRLDTEEDWYTMAPSNQLGDLHQWGILLGIGFAQRVWKNAPGSGRWVPTLDTWNPRSFRWEATEKTWRARTKDGTEVDAGPDRFVIYTPFGVKNPANRGVWSAVAQWWLLKQYAKHDWLKQGQQARGSTVLKPPAPVGATMKAGDERDELTAKRKRQALVDSIMAKVEDRVVALPAGWDMDLVQMEASTHATYQAQIELADRGIAIAITGQNLTSDVTGGSYAAASVHKEVEQTLIISDTSALIDTLHDALLTPWAAYHLREGAAGAPWPAWDTTPPKDRKAEADELTATAAAVTSWNTLLAPHGQQVDIVALAKERGLPLKTLEKAITSREIFAYHLQYGLLSKNELREYLGYPPVAGGDEAPAPVVAAAPDQAA